MFLTKKKKGSASMMSLPMEIVFIIVGIVILTAVAKALLPTAVTAIFDMLTGTTNNLTASQVTTLKDITTALNFVIYLIAVVAMLVMLVYAFMKAMHGRKR